MTKLNKIAQVLVLSGMSCWVSIAQATDIEISQSTNINQQIHASQQVDSSDNSTEISTQSDTAAQSDTQVKANSEEENTAESAPSESTATSSSNTANIGTTQAFDNNSQLITRLSNDAGKKINVTSATTATLAQSFSQVTSAEFPTLAKSNTSENFETVPETGSEAVVPNEDMPAPENVVLNPTLDSATSFVNTSQVTQQLALQPSQQEMSNVENITALDASSSLSQSLSQVTSAEFPALAESAASEEPEVGSEEYMTNEAMPALENVALNYTLDSATSFANTSQITQQLSLQEIGDVQNITTLDAAAQTSQALEQTINTNVEDAITSSTQSAINENVNTQITSAVIEQINTELAAATTAEVINTLTSDLALGL